MMPTYRMEVTHESQAGSVRRHVADAARRLGADEQSAGEASIVATELATNIVKHGDGGEILVREVKGSGTPAIEIHALDAGPGMTSVSSCLRDGFSTSGSAGTGLGAVQRLSRSFQILSQPGRGTAIWVSLAINPRPPPEKTGSFEMGGVSVALKGQDLCGDSWDVQCTGETLRAVVADGLGHGPFAEEASREAVTAFQRHHSAGPAEAMEHIHRALVKTRGAAASMGEIHPGRGRISLAGVGNVLMRVYSGTRSKLFSGDNGTLGAGNRRMTQVEHPWSADSLLVLHSDGISSGWNLDDYPGLIHRHPALIAGVIYRDFRRPHDDATVAVIRQRPA